ncbi:MAG TPA: hypothetical protein VEI98_06880 [Xanthobacteraceae bacterium]|nr:hypothetical protein [Xanthobacteraceae bacterium]
MYRERPDFDQNFHDLFKFAAAQPREVTRGAADYELSLKGFSHARV